MQITTEDVQFPQPLFEEAEPRAPGLHLGQVIESLMAANGLKPTGKFNDIQLAAEIGLLWERVLGKVMANKYVIMHPPQMQLNGIWMSPDGVGPDPEGEVPLVVEEYKATWQSTRRCPSENFRYMTQVKSYCWAVGTTVAMMRIFHLMGNYKGSGPMYRVSRIKFSEQELKDNWQMIVKHRQKMDKSETNNG